MLSKRRVILGVGGAALLVALGSLIWSFWPVPPAPPSLRDMFEQAATGMSESDIEELFVSCPRNDDLVWKDSDVPRLMTWEGECDGATKRVTIPELTKKEDPVYTKSLSWRIRLEQCDKKLTLVQNGGGNFSWIDTRTGGLAAKQKSWNSLEGRFNVVFNNQGEVVERSLFFGTMQPPPSTLMLWLKQVLPF